ncbi:hypothetical protein N7541_002110 [Penicillium brevicompactum]|uniref:DUF1772-domain-containing protein n=1 Tax=Penicillium brevicompactum TaxID=5074 RepID=A0A9W9RJM6_PENBR|nr:hypothetical protein N7541_002110 [Penicillium brevicompactum]
MNTYSVAQIVAISSSFWLSGEIFTYSYGAVHATLEATSKSQTLAAKQWARFYHRGHAIGPACAALGAGTFAWCALSSHNILYWGAAAFNLGIVPWTLLFMVKTNNALFEYAHRAEEKSTEQDDVRLTALLRKWSTLNTIRSFFPFVGGVLGLIAAVA